LDILQLLRSDQVCLLFTLFDPLARLTVSQLVDMYSEILPYPNSLAGPTNDTTRSFLDRTAAFDKKLVYYENDGTVIMKGDNFTTLERGRYRDRLETLTKQFAGTENWRNVAFESRVWPVTVQDYLS